MNMLVLVLLLFVGIPLTELYFLIRVGSYIGALPTILLSVFTALLGGLLLRMARCALSGPLFLQKTA